MSQNRDSVAAEATALRDRLALDRTALANERTFLAYVRTGLTLLVVGFSFIELPIFQSRWFAIQGWAFVPLGVITFAVGAWRFWKVRQDISRAGHAGAA
jgi:putative membrane protein